MVWNEHVDVALEALKTSVHDCHKLYFIHYTLKTILFTDASDFAQEHQLDGNTVEEPIRFLGGTFYGPQTRWSTIEKEDYAIYWALLRLDDLISGIPFTIHTDRTGTSCFLTTTAHAKSCNRNSTFSITMPPSNMSLAKPTSQSTFSADLWPDLVPFLILTLQCSSTQREYRSLLPLRSSWSG